MEDVVEQLKKDPGSVKWGGGSRGSTEHIAAAMIAPRGRRRPVQDQLRRLPRAAARPRPPSWAATSPSAAAATASSAEYITAGKMRADRPSRRRTRLPGVNVPTLKEQGIDVEIGNWRGVYGAPGITPAQRKALTDMVLKARQDQDLARGAREEQLDARRADRRRPSTSSSTTTSPACAPPWSSPAWSDPAPGCFVPVPRKAWTRLQARCPFSRHGRRARAACLQTSLDAPAPSLQDADTVTASTDPVLSRPWSASASC